MMLLSTIFVLLLWILQRSMAFNTQFKKFGSVGLNRYDITSPANAYKNHNNHQKQQRSSSKCFMSTNLNENDYEDSCEVSYEDGFLEELTKKRSYPSILIERFMQSLDDIQVKERAKKAAKEAIEINLGSYSDNMNATLQTSTKEKLMVLGSGWGAYSFLKTVDPTKYDITVISPRNYFTFTPMLAASAVGTVEFRSICEPIRNISPFINFIEASALNINTTTKAIDCQSIKCAGTICEDFQFSVEYDKLLIAVGSMVNTYGIKGVREYCQFLKQVEDAANIRNALAYCFERANIPYLSDEEKRTALTFVIVGAGPTGVELIGELGDWIEYEGRRYFPSLIKYVQIVLVEAGNCVLAVFDQELQKEALNRLTSRTTKLLEAGLIDKEITRVMLGVGVKEVGEKVIKLSTGEDLSYGFCVWAAGVGPTPLVSNLIHSVPTQKELLPKTRGRVATDMWLRAKGCEDVYVIGDCNYVEEVSLPPTAQVASQQGAYLGRLLSKGYRMGNYNQRPPYKFYEESLSISSSGTATVDFINNNKNSENSSNKNNDNNNNVQNNATSTAASSGTGPTTFEINLNDIIEDSKNNGAAQSSLFPSEKLKIGRIGVTTVSTDFNLLSTAANNNNNNSSSTSDSANNSGEDNTRANNSNDRLQVKIEYAKPFQFLNLGVLAYVGASQALAQVNVDDRNFLGSGPIGFLLWRGIYWFKQVSWRNRVLIAIDWLKARVFGRDIGNVKI